MDVLARRVAERFAKQVELNLDWVEGLRKDFLTLMKNLPRVKNYKEADRLREAFKTFRNNFEELVFETFLNRDFKYDVNITPQDKAAFDRTLRKTAWDFSIELRLPMGYPGNKYNPESEESLFGSFERDREKWSNRIKDKARAFWKDMRYFVDWAKGRKGEPYKVDVRDVEQVEMAGFKVRIVGYDPEYAGMMERFKAGLEHFRQRASKVLPLIVQHMLPIVVHAYGTLDEGGTYNGDHITIALTGFTNHDNPNIVAHVLAHEMGHHLFKNYLSEQDQKFWYAAIREDSEPLDVQKLLSMWPEGAWAHELVDKLKDVDPTMALQIDVISTGQGHSGGPEFTTREDFERLLANGTKFVTVKHPITGYAGKNGEEAFCEAIGRLVGFGPATVHPIVIHWLKLIMPGIKVAKQLPGAVLFR